MSTKNIIISPHLLIYKPQISSIFSIFQRISGILLFLILYLYILITLYCSFFGSYFLFYFFIFYIFKFYGFFRITLILMIIFFFYYHLFNGLKILILETEPSGNVVALDFYYLTSYFFLFCSVLFTLITWFYLFF